MINSFSIRCVDTQEKIVENPIRTGAQRSIVTWSPIRTGAIRIGAQKTESKIKMVGWQSIYRLPVALKFFILNERSLYSYMKSDFH